MSAPRPAPLRLLVVDDHEVVRRGLVALLARRQFHVVAQAGTVAQALEAARTYHPDLVVMDARLPDGSGIAARREIRLELPATRVVILTGYADPAALVGAAVAGASGYLVKQIRGRDLVAALETVGRGGSLLDPGVTEEALALVGRVAGGTDQEELAELNAQERRILAHLAEGQTNKEIAAAMFLSDKTIKNYVSSVLSKLHLQRRSQAAAFVASHRPPWVE